VYSEKGENGWGGKKTNLKKKIFREKIRKNVSSLWKRALLGWCTRGTEGRIQFELKKNKNVEKQVGGLKQKIFFKKKKNSPKKV